ncbi:MAG TPA: hypothetical protein VF452_20965 [Candidatus Binatia bacterium]
MFFNLKRSLNLIFFGFVLLLTGCSTRRVLETTRAPIVPEPKIIEEQVSLNASFSAHPRSIRFFEGERTQLAIVNDRTYETRFAKRLARTIYTEIDLDHPRPEKQVHFPIMLYFLQNGKLIRVDEIQARIDPQWSASSPLVGAGYFEAGKWAVGDYEVDVYVNRKKTAIAYFSVY